METSKSACMFTLSFRAGPRRAESPFPNGWAGHMVSPPPKKKVRTRTICNDLLKSELMPLQKLQVALDIPIINQFLHISYKFPLILII